MSYEQKLTYALNKLNYITSRPISDYFQFLIDYIDIVEKLYYVEVIGHENDLKELARDRQQYLQTKALDCIKTELKIMHRRIAYAKKKIAEEQEYIALVEKKIEEEDAEIK